MKKTLQWILVALIWLFATGYAYVGIIFVLLGPMMGPRGDIDYPDFTEAQRRAADTQAVLSQMFGLVPLAVAGLSFFFSVRIAKFVLRILPGRSAK